MTDFIEYPFVNKTNFDAILNRVKVVEHEDEATFFLDGRATDVLALVDILHKCEDRHLDRKFHLI